MQCLMIISRHMSDEQLQHSFLMCLAWLNFDYQVDLVAMDGRLTELLTDPTTTKQWQSLKLYGVNHFYQLTGADAPAESSMLTPIDSSHFDHLKLSAEVML